MATVNIPAYNSTAITGTTTIKSGTDGVIARIIVVSATTGTIRVVDGRGVVIMDTTASMTVSFPSAIELNAAFVAGAVITITGTVSATVLWL